MRVLVVGSGGREHALSWKLSQEVEVICAPGNPGISEDCECLPIPPTDAAELANTCRERSIDLVVVGPEDPLVSGLADHLRTEGIAVFGPGADGARLEASKAFSKKLMDEAGVPTAHFRSFTDAAEATEYARSVADKGHGVVVKASGNALGKGVSVCEDAHQAEDAIQRMMVDRVFGDAGVTVVVEERLRGPEFSLLTLCSDEQILTLPVAQDYKRAHDGDQGPNTGGMGSYSPVAQLSRDLVEEAERAVVRPALQVLNEQGISYRGVLFSGLMLQDGRPYCLEYNVRFGDPETQSIVLRLGSNFAEALLACAQGEPIPPIEVFEDAAVTVVVASGGYPGNYKKGVSINVGDLPQGVKLFHAGTATKDGQLVTSGGRVVAVSATAQNLAAARALAYRGAEQVRFEGAYYRRDIALSSV